MLYCPCTTDIGGELPYPNPSTLRTQVERVRAAVRGAGLVLLQREVPEEVNVAAAEAAAEAGIRVIQV